MMKPRLNLFAAAPGPMQTLVDFSTRISQCSLEKSLLELVKMRASQINGCAHCINMHAKEALKAGETPVRLLLLDAFRESPLYTARERAALVWAEALTRIADGRPSDEDYQLLQAEFSAEEQVELTMMIVTTNAWNRFAVGFGVVHPVDKADQPAVRAA